MHPELFTQDERSENNCGISIIYEDCSGVSCEFA
jgi:hypothetical protein